MKKNLNVSLLMLLATASSAQVLQAVGNVEQAPAPTSSYKIPNLGIKSTYNRIMGNTTPPAEATFRSKMGPVIAEVKAKINSSNSSIDLSNNSENSETGVSNNPTPAQPSQTATQTVELNSKNINGKMSAKGIDNISGRQTLAERAQNAYEALPNVSGKLAKATGYNSKAGQLAQDPQLENNNQPVVVDGWNFSTVANAIGRTIKTAPSRFVENLNTQIDRNTPQAEKDQLATFDAQVENSNKMEDYEKAYHVSMGNIPTAQEINEINKARNINNGIRSVYHTPGALARTAGLGDGNFISNVPTNIASAGRATGRAVAFTADKISSLFTRVQKVETPADAQAIAIDTTKASLAEAQVDQSAQPTAAQKRSLSTMVSNFAKSITPTMSMPDFNQALTNLRQSISSLFSKSSGVANQVSDVASDDMSQPASNDMQVASGNAAPQAEQPPVPDNAPSAVDANLPELP